MIFINPLFVNILKTLITEGVEFMLIGGYAVNFHGYGRPTGDLDILLKPDHINKEGNKSFYSFKS